MDIDVWQQKDYDVEDHRSLYVYHPDKIFHQHIIRSMHTVLLKHYPNKPPPFELVDNAVTFLAFQLVYVEELNEYGGDAQKGLKYPECQDHIPFLNDMIEEAHCERQKIWTKNTLAKEDFLDLYPLYRNTVRQFQIVHEVMREFTHPVDAPSCEEFLKVLEVVSDVCYE